MTHEAQRDAWDRLSPHLGRNLPVCTDEVLYGPYTPSEGSLQLLGEVAGRRILELGCGAAQASIALAKQDAHCTAVDFSREQLRYAEELAAEEGVSVQFHCAEMHAYLRNTAPGSFDIVLSVCALQYVEDLGPLFALVRCALVEGGLFVFSMDHPLNDLVRMRDGHAVLVRGYFDRGAICWRWEGQEEGPPFVAYHRTLGDVLDLLVEAGFCVERLLEPEPTDEHAAALRPEELERGALLPTVMLWKARACGRPGASV